ncbi:zinc ribbon domain-containing protein [Virgibacillus siamensis]|uniref:zinc ribbon domain-containing protein n=1 Tax=Virgibacillus siamensis TaxID=480071 RepID=UPI00098600F0|nr:zinc ribbon domain-containing protein [Virgibacillus siamensis]
MKCPNCGLESEEGKYCTNCGEELAAFGNEDSTDDQTSEKQTSDENKQQSNETAVKIKTTVANFGHFLLALIRNPSEARKANKSDFSSGIIMFILYALLLALSYHFIINSLSFGSMGFSFMIDISFLDSFIIPFLLMFVLYFVIAGLTFLCSKLTVQAVKFPDVVAKYGAYLVPFFILYAAGIVCILVGLPGISLLVISLSILGMLIIAPTFILLEQPSDGFDRIYILLGLYIIIFLVYGFFIRFFLDTIMGRLMNSIMGGF